MQDVSKEEVRPYKANIIDLINVEVEKSIHASPKMDNHSGQYEENLRGKFCHV